MRIGIIAANNIRYSPYIFFYTKILDEAKINYELIIPDRNPDLKDSFESVVHILPWNNKYSSIVNYLKYSKNVKSFVKKKKYEFLIVLTTVNAVFCSGWLKDKYAGKYLVDIRDYTYENNKIYYYLEKKSVKNSFLNVISSEKFKLFLPESRYLVCHNINTPYDGVDYKFKKKSGKIVIGYVGAVSYKDQCIRLMQLVDHDERFEFHIYGAGVAIDIVRQYANSLRNSRIQLYGIYDPSEKDSIIQAVDILFNAYGNGTPLLDYALSNKLYDSMYYHKPLLTSPKTSMEELGGCLAYSLDLCTENSLDGLWNWYTSLSAKDVDKYADRMYSCFIRESKETKRSIMDCLSKLNK
ncbi:MAG: hypothetical protein K0S47_3849 [Herbinix sp.]|jgi:hypothetical protein|nr:hypothetical protein [Herbinix sp.]